MWKTISLGAVALGMVLLVAITTINTPKTDAPSKTAVQSLVEKNGASQKVLAELKELREKVTSGWKSVSVTGVDQFLLNWARPFAGIAFLGLALLFGWQNKTVPMYVAFGIGLALLGLPYFSDSILDGTWWAQASTRLFGTIQTHPWEWTGAAAIVGGAVLLRGKKYLAGVSLFLVGMLLLAQPPLQQEVRNVFKRVEESTALTTASTNPLPRDCKEGATGTLTLTSTKWALPRGCTVTIRLYQGGIAMEDEQRKPFTADSEVPWEWPAGYEPTLVWSSTTTTSVEFFVCQKGSAWSDRLNGCVVMKQERGLGIKPTRGAI